MATSSKLRDLRGKGEMELQIPGFPDYTIDTDLTVRSYKCYKTHVLKPHKTKGCQLLRDNKKCHITPVKLLYCAQRNIDPLKVDGRKFMILTDGTVVERANLKGVVGKIDNNGLPNNGFKSKASALRQIQTLYQGLLAQKKTLTSNSPKPVADFLIKFKQSVITAVVNYGNRVQYKNEIERRYDEFAMMIGKRFLDNNMAKASLHMTAARMMVSLVKQEKENSRKTDYQEVEFGMTEDGMYRQ